MNLLELLRCRNDFFFFDRAQCVQGQSGSLAPRCRMQIPGIVPTPTPENHRFFYVLFLLLAEKCHSGPAARDGRRSVTSLL